VLFWCEVEFNPYNVASMNNLCEEDCRPGSVTDDPANPCD